MKKILKFASGVTLLEIMLVLAVAAMIIVMSVRYYQSATANEQTNAIMEQLEAIVAASYQLEQSTGNWCNANMTQANVAPLLPANGLVTPWGAGITLEFINPGGYCNAFLIRIDSVPAQICNLFVAKVTNDNHFTVNSGNCGTQAASITFLYNAAP